jgi:DNA-binding LacI/PurR family transcriptional regulator
MRDVAERAGVSQSTVSRVLSGSKTQIPISDETRERVERIAQEIGYRPHPGARSLSGNRTGLIGLIVREINDPFFAELIDVVSRVAKEQDYDLVLGNAKRDPGNALVLRDRMLDLRFCDGLLLCGDLRESSEDRTFLTNMGGEHPLVSVSRGSKQLVRSTPSVDIDNRKGVLLALEHLTELGHRRIACLNAGRVGDLWERLETYTEFMEERLDGVPEGCVVPAENSFQGGYEAAEQLLSLPDPPTALFGNDDVMAVGALSAAVDTGCPVPERLSIVGFDDIDLSACVRPALTTIRQPVEEIGRRAVELLLETIDGQIRSDTCPRILIEPKLVVRQSCGLPAPD